MPCKTLYQTDNPWGYARVAPPVSAAGKAKEAQKALVKQVPTNKKQFTREFAPFPFNLTYGTSGSGYTYSAGGNYGFYVGQDWPLDTNGRASGHSMSWYGYTSTGGIDYATYAGTSQAQRWNGNRLAARSRSTDRRWEYRYNERGEVTSAWQQSDTNVANVTSGEPLAGSGSTYSYDAIGNRASHVEGGPATSTAGTAPNGLPSSTLGLNASRTHNYTGNAANQYTSIVSVTPSALVFDLTQAAAGRVLRALAQASGV